MKIPFAAEEFYGVFSAYNTAIWLMQVPLLARGVLAIVMLTREHRNFSIGISIILTALWTWQALGYHLAIFAAINPLAFVFAAVLVGDRITWPI